MKIVEIVVMITVITIMVINTVTITNNQIDNNGCHLMKMIIYV